MKTSRIDCLIMVSYLNAQSVLIPNDDGPKEYGRRTENLIVFS